MDRWEALFAGLTAEGAATEAAEADAETEDLVRAVISDVGLVDRLRSSTHIALHVAAHGVVRGRVVDVGRDVVLIDASDDEWAVPFAGIEAIEHLDRRVQPPTTVGARLGLAATLRTWSRQRSVVRVMRVYGVPVDGTIDRVCADHLDLAVHDPGLPRRDEHVRAILTVPFAAISAARRR